MNIYTQVAIPGSIDHLVDELRQKYNRPLPAADLLISNSYDELMEDVVDVKDLGSGVIGGTDATTLRSGKRTSTGRSGSRRGRAPIRAGTRSRPRSWPAVRRDNIQIRDWKIGGDVASGGFNFTPPPGARQVDVADLSKLKDMSDLPSNFSLGGK